jgi:hypothetical protein
LATISQTPELALNDSEARSLAIAAGNVQRHYRLAWIKDEHLALGVFASTAFAIYRGKAMAVMARRRAEGARPAGMGAAPGAAPARPRAPAPAAAPHPPPPAGFAPAVSAAEAASDWLGTGSPAVN